MKIRILNLSLLHSSYLTQINYSSVPNYIVVMKGLENNE